MTEPTKREVELVQEFADWLQEHAHDSFPVDDIWYRQLEQRIADYREKLLASSAQSAEPQEAEAQLVQNMLQEYKDSQHIACEGLHIPWDPEPYDRALAALASLRARLASKPSQDESPCAKCTRCAPCGPPAWESYTESARPSREEEMQEALEATAEALECTLQRLGVCGEGDGPGRNADVDSWGGTNALRLARAALAQGGARDDNATRGSK